MSTSGAGSIPDPSQTANPETGQGAPGEAGQGDEHPLEWYREQYEQIRPEYTRATQARSAAEERASQYEALFEALSDPEQAPEILRELGYEMDTGEEPEGQVTPDDEFVDPLEAKVAELEQLAQHIQSEREQEAQSAEEERILNLRDEYIDSAIKHLQDQEGTAELDDDDVEVLGNLAIVMADAEGVPDVLGAYNRLYGEKGLLENHRQRWIDTKNAFPAPLGQSGSSEKRPTNRRERVQFLDARMRALDAQQQ